MVQPPARIRLPDLWRGHAGHICTHGDVAPLRDDRVAPRPVRAGPVWARLQGHDGRRNPAGSRLARTFFALKAIFALKPCFALKAFFALKAIFTLIPALLSRRFPALI